VRVFTAVGGMVKAAQDRLHTLPVMWAAFLVDGRDNNPEIEETDSLAG